jgi:hypothetical protein
MDAWGWIVEGFHYARYCTSLEVQDYWLNKEDGDEQ